MTGSRWRGLPVVVLLALVTAAVALGVARLSDPGSAATAPGTLVPALDDGIPPAGAPARAPAGAPARAPAAAPAGRATSPPRPQLPGGGRTIFPGRILVAYYGTAGTGALGVLGEDTPDRITPRLRAAARPFATPGREVQIVYELIATVADPTPGADGDYSHDIDRASVRSYVRAARRHDALLVLDLQPGRTDFATVARRWRWALEKPWVGLALDPEWRMGPGQVPGRAIGQVRAREVNRVSEWLASLTAAGDLPEKVFMLHQFRTDMVLGIDRVRTRPGLVTVQHADGFGSRQAKLDTYAAVARPRQFHLGFKLFYDEDTDLFGPRQVLRLRPRVDFVSYQ